MSSSEPDKIVMTLGTLVGIFLSYSPVGILERIGYTEEMKVTQLHAFRDGHDCVELSILRPNPSWRALVYVDRSRDYVPVQFTQECEGIVRSDLRIQYAADKQIGWRISEWSKSSFGASGGVKSSSLCRVKRCSVNEPLPDGLFTLEYPQGTHVAEVDGNSSKYFVSLGGGKRRYISEDEYARVPPPSVGDSEGMLSVRAIFAAVSVVLILAIVIVFAARRRAQKTEERR